MIPAVHRVNKKVSPNIVAVFSSRLEFQSHILPTYLVILCARNGIFIIQLPYSILQWLDFSVL